MIWTTYKYVREASVKAVEKLGRDLNESEESALKELIRNKARSKARDLLATLQNCLPEDVSHHLKRLS